ncbi:hypothetical protein GOODEAATRI_008862 [Goodea atripinnis]|uniref:Double minute 2 protein n=1 Tax=Goodea atripinnis TaxID=208336 RepID=A0ABV0N0N4_9TELE
MQKQLYDQKQQHIVHCAQDALGRVLGVDSFSVKEPGVLFTMITRNLVAVKSQGPSNRAEGEDNEEESEEEESDDSRKRRRSDSFSLTFDDSLSWCVIGGLGSGRDRHSSQSSDSHSTVYEVTIFEAEEDDSFDEDTEITEADYWRCAKCDELNPPLPRHCLRCWTLRHDWLPDASIDPKALPTKPTDLSAAKEAPDGKRAKTPLNSQGLSDSSAPNSQDLICSSQPSSSFSSGDSQEFLTSSPSQSALLPELERSVSAESRLPDSCLDPCLICQSRPKNGCIVHGRTGHLMSCYVCARKLKKRNKLCPVCRMPIQSVVLTYLS